MVTRLALLLALLLWPALAKAQRAEVIPEDARLTITIENVHDEFLESEMILLTIHGVYRRHITRENLIQPSLNGFGWMQLGEDYWYESTENGLQVKNMRRRMALYPNRVGKVEIGRFRHILTFLDENQKWFEHEISSEPIVIDVGKPEGSEGWWLPVHRLELEDSWSNAPDQLQAGSGVLRVIRVEAHGASPDMLPPMPELKSPSAHIYPHPEKRMVELTPRGPVAIAFWRWTVRPTNDASAILEPINVDFYDTVARENKRVEITAQRIAYGTITGREASPELLNEVVAGQNAGPKTASRSSLLGIIGLVLVSTLSVFLWSSKFLGFNTILRRLRLDADSRKIRQAVTNQDVAGLRRSANSLAKRHGLNPADVSSLRELDSHLFAKSAERPNLSSVVKRMRAEISTLSEQEMRNNTVHSLTVGNHSKPAIPHSSQQS